jgi:hypothetical protein
MKGVLMSSVEMGPKGVGVPLPPTYNPAYEPLAKACDTIAHIPSQNVDLPGLACESGRTVDRVGRDILGVLFWFSLVSWITYRWSEQGFDPGGSELADCIHSHDPALLPDGTDIPGRSTRDMGNETPQTGSEQLHNTSGCENLDGNDNGHYGTGVRIMPTRILRAHKFTKVLYDGPERTDIKLRFQSSAPVNLYGVSSIFFDRFKKDRTSDLFNYPDQMDFTKRIPLNVVMTNEWYLIMENRSDKDVAIHYEVFDV